VIKPRPTQRGYPTCGAPHTPAPHRGTSRTIPLYRVFREVVRGELRPVPWWELPCPTQELLQGKAANSLNVWIRASLDPNNKPIASTYHAERRYIPTFPQGGEERITTNSAQRGGSATLNLGLEGSNCQARPRSKSCKSGTWYRSVIGSDRMRDSSCSFLYSAQALLN